MVVLPCKVVGWQFDPPVVHPPVVPADPVSLWGKTTSHPYVYPHNTFVSFISETTRDQKLSEN